MAEQRKTGSGPILSPQGKRMGKSAEWTGVTRPDAPGARPFLIYSVAPRLVADWDGFADHAASLGFNALLIGGTGRGLGLAPVSKRGLDVYRDLHPRRGAAAQDALPDPRHPSCSADASAAALADDIAAAVADGVTGFRCLDPHAIPAATWRDLIAAHPACRFLAWTPGLSRTALAGLEGLGFAAVFDSLAWWDGAAGWYAEESHRLAAIGPAIATVEAPGGRRLAAGFTDAGEAEAAARHRLALAAGLGGGIIVPMGFEFGARIPLDPERGSPADWEWLRENAAYDLSQPLQEATAALAPHRPRAAPLAPLLGPGGTVTALLRRPPGAPQSARLVVANPDLRRPVQLPTSGLTQGGFSGLSRGEPLMLPPGAVRCFAAEATEHVQLALGDEAQARRATAAPRVGIEAVSPAIEDGRFAIKRRLGKTVSVTADLVTDGHERTGAVLQWRAADAPDWQETRLTPLGNDRWAGEFPLARLGRHVFRLLAWHDAFGTFLDGLAKKHAAGVDVSLELEEGRLLVAGAGQALADVAQRLAAGDSAARLSLLLDPATAALMAAADPRPNLAQSAEYPVEADRAEAEFSSWYELFPRSQSGDGKRHGTFADVIAQLPRIRAMGFDTLYFPPIHPIGTASRKGPNNTLTPAPGDPGSPYAIGSPEGGHEAIHPELGTLEDFQALRRAAAEHGLELALDFAIQCSPDHPWLRAHPEWFEWRPDGSLRTAENPPKKYQDITNIDFYAAGARPAAWMALRDSVLFWAAQGIRCFRVDNPHTKPFPFWEWMIGEVRGRHPDAIFLAEAFTRPKIMYRLAKLGFGQSYTYFTWRDSKAELTEYLTELTQGPARDFFRPHFFVNTPDINPHFLQRGGRPGHLIRAALGATLSGLWGVYQGFEFCEATALPGREEYLDSEKYQLRAWPARAAGDIVDEIAQLNLIRRTNPAMQSHLGLEFCDAFNDNIIAYRKATADRSNVVFCAVNLDPHAAQEADIRLPFHDWELPEHAALEAEDLVHGNRFTWHGAWQRLRLDPGIPYGIWRIRPAAGAGR